MSYLNSASKQPFLFSVYVAVASTLLLVVLFMVGEPTLGQAIEDEFTTSQTINAEIAFLVTANNITMDGAIGGLTGGTANGDTTVVVTTNNTAGYNMTVDFANSDYGVAAMNQTGGSGYINDYVPATEGVPDFTFASETFSQLAYTVNASTTADLDTTFRNNGTACNNDSGGDTENSCWYGPSSTAETIINRSTPTIASGATTTLSFRVNVPNNPDPVLPSGVYVATATLTAVTN